MRKIKLFLSFKLICKDTYPGDSVYVSGNIKELGNWDINRAVKMFTSEDIFPIWETSDIPMYKIPEMIEYKYFIKKINNNQIFWENSSNNRKFKFQGITYVKTEKIILIGENFNEINKRGYHVITESSKNIEFEQNKDKFRDENIKNLFKQSNTEYSNNTLEDFDLDQYLSRLKLCIEEIEKNNCKLKEYIKNLIVTFKNKRKLDVEIILLIFIHFAHSGQLKSPESFNESYGHNNHHDPYLAKSLYTYLLTNINDENSILIHSILNYIPTCLDYKNHDVDTINCVEKSNYM